MSRALPFNVWHHLVIFCWQLVDILPILKKKKVTVYIYYRNSAVDLKSLWNFPLLIFEAENMFYRRKKRCLISFCSSMAAADEQNILIKGIKIHDTFPTSVHYCSFLKWLRFTIKGLWHFFFVILQIKSHWIKSSNNIMDLCFFLCGFFCAAGLKKRSRRVKEAV